MRKLLLALVKAKRITALVGTVAALALAAAPGTAFGSGGGGTATVFC